MDRDNRYNPNKNLSKRDKLSVFYGNPTLSFIYQKSQKISCAIYLVTNHLSSQEPLKWRIRKSSLDLVKDIFSLRKNFSKNVLVFDDLKYRINELSSFLDLLCNTGFISNMNYQVLNGEIVNLSQFLSQNYDLTNSSSDTIDNDFFEVSELGDGREASKYGGLEELPGYSSVEESNISHFVKGHGKGRISKGHVSFRNTSLRTGQKDNLKGQEVTAGSKRKQEIIRIIKDKKKVMIKDITSLIGDYSEKTVQRDLVALVKAGVLKKEGERRWSKYMLA
ncbi:MAG TPA: DeoR family transcriptional regulator [Candidatus Paceibacterota bacterium]|jgi:hypothetical protein|nr:hypothetical protein [Parcubacteria group bacterium]MDP6119580.1 DeoR family transcriptional regulator [Candidatus Paceibacterota bacterium]HJN62825.1 DeoR family transcriptional regulator [Candidatus Paceibacterota bacterium]|tara:strand:+ start:1003 stop:1836 length:834 start_codon:yes stop_codon:yes gene_type:complete